MSSTIFRAAMYVPLALAISSAASGVTPKVAPATQSQSWNFEAEASKLLNEVKELSGKLKTDASRLDMLSYQPARSWHSHAHELNQAREHINAIGERLDRLQAIQSVVAPWQQSAISDIVPIAANIADHTQSAIEHLNDNRTYLFAPAYREHLSAISDHSNDLKSTLDTHIELARTSEKQQKLEQKLDQLRDQLDRTES